MGEFFAVLLVGFLIIILIREFIKLGGFPRLYCALGHHEYDSWDYISPGQCIKKKCCSICGEILSSSQEKLEHSWEMKYLHDGTCERQEVCLHCGLTKGDVVTIHTWEEIFVGDDTNIKNRRCKRCSHLDKPYITQTQWPEIFVFSEERRLFLLMQAGLQQILKSNDLFTLDDGSRGIQVKMAQSSLPETNLKVYGFNIGLLNYYFYPDGVYTLHAGEENSVTRYSRQNFVFSGIYVPTIKPPPDSIVVGKTWVHCKKDGGPDLRYSYNPSIPIASYALFSLFTTSDGEIQIAISNYDSVQNFYTILMRYLGLVEGTASRGQRRRENSQKGYGQQRSNNNDHENNTTGKDSSSREETGEGLTIEKARTVLGVSPQASQEEVRKAYFELVKKYHPDKVSHLAEEFRLIAEERMKEINAAYELLNKSR